MATANVVQDLHELDGNKFGCVYADPPWRYGNTRTRSSVGGKSASSYMSTMTVEQICDEPVANLAADNSHLHLWTTSSFLPDAFKVISSWGFEYKSSFVWVKPQMGIGNYWRLSHEYLLLGVRGKLVFQDKSLKSWVQAMRTGHSVKPHQVRDMIMRASPGPYLELYGREMPMPEWTVYGNEIKRSLV